MNKLFYFIFILVAIYFYNKIKNLEKSLKENMSNTSNIDYEAIKNLGVIARGLNKGGFKVPGNLIVDGTLQTKNLNVKNDLGNVNIQAQNTKWANVKYSKRVAINKYAKVSPTYGLTMSFP